MVRKIGENLAFFTAQRMTKNDQVEMHRLKLRLCLRGPTNSSSMKICANNKFPSS